MPLYGIPRETLQQTSPQTLPLWLEQLRLKKITQQERQRKAGLEEREMTLAEALGKARVGELGKQPAPFGKPPWYLGPEHRETQRGRIAGGLEPRAQTPEQEIIRWVRVAESAIALGNFELAEKALERVKVLEGSLGGDVLKAKPQPTKKVESKVLSKPPVRPLPRTQVPQPVKAKTEMPKESQAAKQVSDLLPTLPNELLKKINAALSAGATFQEILEAPELQPYLKK